MAKHFDVQSENVCVRVCVCACACVRVCVLRMRVCCVGLSKRKGERESMCVCERAGVCLRVRAYV